MSKGSDRRQYNKTLDKQYQDNKFWEQVKGLGDFLNQAPCNSTMMYDPKTNTVKDISNG